MTYQSFLAGYVKQSGNCHDYHFVNMFVVQMYSILWGTLETQWETRIASGQLRLWCWVPPRTTVGKSYLHKGHALALLVLMSDMITAHTKYGFRRNCVMPDNIVNNMTSNTRPYISLWIQVIQGDIVLGPLRSWWRFLCKPDNVNMSRFSLKIRHLPPTPTSITQMRMRSSVMNKREESLANRSQIKSMSYTKGLQMDGGRFAG